GCVAFAWSKALLTEFCVRRMRRRVLVAAVTAGTIAFVPGLASAEGLFDFLFAPPQKQRHAPAQANFFADPFGLNQQPAPAPRPVATAGSGPAFCVRSCDGKYFAVTARGGASPAQMCQAFCPASATKIYFGSTIDGAASSGGERY